MEPDPEQHGQPQDPHRLEREESRLWRWVLGFMVLLALAVAVLSWERLQRLPYSLAAIPIGLVILVFLFAAYAYGRRREVSELKVMLAGLENRVGTVPSEEQLDELSQVIKRSQRSFKELIDSLDDVAFTMSLDGTLRTVNRRVAELLKLSYSQVVGHRLDEFIDTPKRQEVENGLPRFVEKRHWAGLVKVSLKAVDRILYFDCVLNAIVKDDEVVGVSILARDVTEERRKETRFTELFETLHEGVYFSTPEGKLLDANPALVQILGYSSKEELLAAEPADLSLDSTQPAPLGRTPGDSGGIRAREITLRRQDGRPAVCLDTSRAVWDGAGNIVRYQGTLQDVTEQRAMEKQIEEQRQFQRNLLESFPDLILVIDRDERYSFVSRRIHDLLGFEPDVWLGKRVSDISDQSPEFLDLYRDVVSGKRLSGFTEYGVKHRSGTWHSMRASARALFDANNTLSGVVASVRDITIEKKLEQQVIQGERLAAMGQMIGGFAHELNNPLTAILGLSEILQDGTSLSDTDRKQVSTINTQARRAADIVQNLMYFARPPAPGKNRLNVNELIQRTLQLHAYSLRKNSITVDFLPNASLPAVVGDPNQLMQVFLNLLLNAEQAIREVREKGTLRIRVADKNALVLATFQDDGPGISAETLPHIFDPFYTTKRPGRGTGLGLSICKALLKEHGGNIEATSAPEGGAVFTVTLPAEAEAAMSTTSK
ncbi:MAG TPA: PAS domain S-box protein [Terriglobales bacterium]|nr:PAS domain S-box protein [Terriglobales bacterium]